MIPTSNISLLLAVPRHPPCSKNTVSQSTTTPAQLHNTSKISHSHFDASLPIPVSTPHATISKPLLLPDLNLLLDFLQALLTRPPGRLSMSGRHSNKNALLLNINLAQAMRNSNRNKPMLLPYRARNGLQSTQSQRRVRRVGKMCNGLAIE